MSTSPKPNEPRGRKLRLASLIEGLLERHRRDRRRARDAALRRGDLGAGTNHGAAEAALRGHDEPQFTVDTMLRRTRHAGFGLLIALLALLSLPGMGLSVPFGLALAFGGLQMLIGWRTPWLPRSVGRIRLPVSVLHWLNERLPRWTAGIERIVRPRFTFMVEGPLWCLCGLAIVLQGLGLSLPLPIPGSNSFFIIPAVLYSIALLEDDGLLVMFCHALVSVQILLIVWAWETIAHGLHQMWVMLTG